MTATGAGRARVAVVAIALAAITSACQYQGPPGAPKVGVLGDSIVHQAEAQIRARLTVDHRVAVHAFNNAHFNQLRAPAEQMAATGSRALVIAAGSPDVVAAASPDYGFVPIVWIRQLMTAVTDVPCVALVTVKENGVAPVATPNWRQGARNINRELRRQAEALANVVLVDWSAIADRHPEWFGSDGLHLTAAGRVGYARALDDAADC